MVRISSYSDETLAMSIFYKNMFLRKHILNKKTLTRGTIFSPACTVAEPGYQRSVVSLKLCNQIYVFI
jgi:hypothetical protein